MREPLEMGSGLGSELRSPWRWDRGQDWCEKSLELGLGSGSFWRWDQGWDQDEEPLELGLGLELASGSFWDQGWDRGPGSPWNGIWAGTRMKKLPGNEIRVGIWVGKTFGVWVLRFPTPRSCSSPSHLWIRPGIFPSHLPRFPQPVQTPMASFPQKL